MNATNYTGNYVFGDGALPTDNKREPICEKHNWFYNDNIFAPDTCGKCESELEAKLTEQYERAERLYLRACEWLEFAQLNEWEFYHLFGGALLRDKDLKMYGALKNIFSKRIDRINKQFQNL